MKKLKISYAKKDTKKSLAAALYAVIFIMMITAVEFLNLPQVKAGSRISIFTKSPGSGTVAPIAPFKKDADVWFKRMGTTKEKWIAGLPTKSELGVPVYPGAVIVIFQAGFYGKKETLLPELGLTTPDPLKKVEAWYKEKLNNWTLNKDYHSFLPPNVKVDVMSDKYRATPHIDLETLMTKNQGSGMFINQPKNAKTLITIRYKKK